MLTAVRPEKAPADVWAYMLMCAIRVCVAHADYSRMGALAYTWYLGGFMGVFLYLALLVEFFMSSIRIVLLGQARNSPKDLELQQQ